VKKDLLLEIGCENLPSGYLTGALELLEKLIREGLGTNRIPYGALEVEGTPRRLVVHITELGSKQESIEERIVGPPVSAGIGPDGAFTKAADGFARSQGVAADKLVRVQTDRGEYLALVKRIAGKTSTSLLRQMIPAICSNVKFPKMMRWDSSDFRFARPVRWVVALIGDKVLKFKLGNLTSSRMTRLSPYFEDEVELQGIQHYFDLLARNGIILKTEKRRKVVEKMARKEAAATGGRLVEDSELTASVANLLETPVVLAGRFSEDFLKLPREVIVTALKSHQRYFSVEGSSGQLEPYFIAFADGARRNKREILKGYERVLQARLADAEFYYREDTTRPLIEMSGKLDGVVWLEGLGTMAEKAQRMQHLAGWLHERWPAGGDLGEKIGRAARLAKADLASEMVKDGKEFTLLQGYIGREYARASGESDDIAEAIYEHYLPRFSGDGIPSGELGTLLAVADKLDTIAGGFVLGFEPTGSQDPYALRRQALGLLRIIIEKQIPVSLPEGIDRAVGLFGEDALSSSEKSPEELKGSIWQFLGQRLNVMLRSAGFDYDLVASVLGSYWVNPFAVREMTAELLEMRRQDELLPFVLAMKRVINIIPAGMKGDVTREMAVRSAGALAAGESSELAFSPEAFADDAEQELYEAAGSIFGDLRERFGESGAGGCFEILTRFVPTINRYFDEVLVNCEDKSLRQNRLAMLTEIHRALCLYCDFSAIAGEPSPRNSQ
jgi:glycyl-tRNA synthetase beta chain